MIRLTLLRFIWQLKDVILTTFSLPMWPLVLLWAKTSSWWLPVPRTSATTQSFHFQTRLDVLAFGLIWTTEIPHNRVKVIPQNICVLKSRDIFLSKFLLHCSSRHSELKGYTCEGAIEGPKEPYWPFDCGTSGITKPCVFSLCELLKGKNDWKHPLFLLHYSKTVVFKGLQGICIKTYSTEGLIPTL